MFQDRVLKCADCGAEFPFTASEQQFFEERGFHSPPRRCRECRKTRRDSGGAGGAGGGGGARPERSHGGGGGHGGGGDRPRREDRPSFPATCSQCGAETTVPFKPDPARATFCRACYAERRGSTGGGGERR
jgi:CxxC-x17-CxxC domain-containing protein